MKWYLLQIIVFALFLIVSVTHQQQQQVTFENDPCKEDLNTLITTTFERKRRLKETESSIEVETRWLNEYLEEAAGLRNEVQNLTAQIEEMEGTCTGFVPQDCCQVIL